MEGDEELLHGGIANAGAVVRVGSEVRRPANPHSASIHRFLGALRDVGFDGVPQPIAIENGRERLAFVPGDVPLPPYPAWAQTDDALASVAALVRRFHDAATTIGVPDSATWSDEMFDQDAARPEVVCHNDVCLENVVFRDGIAVALLDFDFAAPGRATYDVAAFARMCVPVDDDENAARLGWRAANRPQRLRVVADAYRLDAAGRGDLLAILDAMVARGGEFVRRRVEAGDPNFIAMWNDMGGMERFDRRRDWWATSRREFAVALS